MNTDAMKEFEEIVKGVVHAGSEVNTSDAVMNDRIWLIMNAHARLLVQTVNRVGGTSVHSSEFGGFCRKSGDKFDPCMQCLKDEATAPYRAIINGEKHED